MQRHHPVFFPPVYIRTMISAFEWLPLKKKTVLNVQVAIEGELTWTQRGRRSPDRRRRRSE